MTTKSKQGGIYVDGKLIGHVVSGGSAVFDIEVGGMPEAHVTQAAMETLQQTAPDLARRCVILAGDFTGKLEQMQAATREAEGQLRRLAEQMDNFSRVRLLHVHDMTRLFDLEPSDADLSGHVLARLEKKRRQAEAKTARQEQIRRRGGKR